MAKVSQRMTVTVRVKRQREYRARWFVAGLLLRAVAWVTGCRVSVADDF